MRLRVALSFLTLVAACAPRSATPAAAGVAAVTNVDWVLTELDGKALSLTERLPTLRLDPATGRATGNAGCNRFTGGYTQAGDSLRFSALALTRMMCAEPERNALEQAFTSTLAVVTGAATPAADRLELTGPSGIVARFRRP